MDLTDRKVTYAEALKIFGARHQETKAVEEMSELTKEICKFWDGHDNLENIADEIADVLITMEQLQMIFDLEDKVKEHMDIKIRRLNGQLLKELHGLK